MLQKKIISIIATMLLAVSGFYLQAQSTNKEIHDKYEKQVIFAEEPIDFENIDDGILKDRFTLLNTIYGRIFLEKPLADYYSEYNWNYDFTKEKFKYNFSINIFIDGEKQIKWYYELTPQAFRKNRIMDIVIAPAEDSRYRYSMESNDWVEKISRLPEGDHQVKLTLRAENAENPGLKVDPVAGGQFTIHVEEAKLDEFKNKFTVGLPRATIDNEDIEAQIVDATVRMYEGMTPIEAVIIEPTGKFQYRRDRTGVILSRNFIAAVVLKRFDDKCFVRSARYFQEHKGHFEFDNVRMSKKLEDYLNYQIPCRLVGTSE